MPKPDSTLDWLTGNADPASRSEEPLADLKLNGYSAGDTPTALNFNWLIYLIDLWLKYLDGQIDSLVVGDGSEIFSGASDPDVGTGVDGDFYFNTSSGDYFKKVLGAWELQANLTGPAGTSGSGWHYGLGVPDNGLGLDGDLYFDTGSGLTYSKAAGVWTEEIDLTGPQGPQGPAAGSNTHIQYNDDGSLGASANFLYDGALKIIGSDDLEGTRVLDLKNSSLEDVFTVDNDGTLGGKSIGFNTTNQSMRLGYRAGEVATGLFWTAIGTSAAQKATTANSFVAIGPSAALNHTTGGFFVAIGPSSGQNNTTGTGWAAIGNGAGSANVDKNYWTALGYNAGQNNQSGEEWVAIGFAAGRLRTNGLTLSHFTKSVYVGAGTRGTNGTSGAPTENENVFGYAAHGKGANTVAIGNSSITDNYFNGHIHAQGNGKGLVVSSPDGLSTLTISIDNNGNLLLDTSIVSVPKGGTAGQVLKKIDGTDFNTEWAAESGGGGGAGFNAIGNSGATPDVDWSTAKTQSITLDNTAEFTFSNPTAGDTYSLILTQDGTGGHTVTWPAAVKWPGGVAPTLSAGAGEIDIIEFLYDGTNYFGGADFDYA